jgi:hypothetical protein
MKFLLFLLPLLGFAQTGTQVNYRNQVSHGPLYYYDTVAQLPSVNCPVDTRFAVVAGALYHNTAFPPSCLWQAYNFNNTPVVTDFGCVGNGVTNDTACVQSAINAIEGNNRGLTIPAGYTFCVDSLSITGSIVIGGGGTLKRCDMLSDTIEQGLIDIKGPGVIISNISIDGQTLSPQVQINYLQVPIESPFDSLVWRNSSIIIHGGANNTIIGPNVKINHTGGYAIWVDSRAANTSHISIIDNTITNSRSSVCGTPGHYNYGCWTGGIFWSNDGVTYAIDELNIQNNKLLQVSGNGIWGHAAAIALQNTGVRVLRNYCEDMGLDCIQMENVRGGIVAHNSGKRIGYVSTVDNTPGVPKWQPSTGIYQPGHVLPGILYFSVPAVAVDTSALVTGVEYSDNNFDAINGGWYDTDGFGSGNVYPGTGTSCHFSTDPFAQSTLCGPGSDGINYAYGFNQGNSSGSPLADNNVNLVGGQFNGFGGGAIKVYGCSFCKVTGASINHPATNAPAGINYSPITYGPFTIGPTTFYPAHLQISGNTAFWSPPTPGWVVSEDNEYAAFNSSNNNIVRDNTCQTTTVCYEFFKNPATTSSSGPLRLTSVTPAACDSPGASPYPLCNVEVDVQVEGTAASSWVTRFYRNTANVGYDAFDITSDHTFTPGFVWAGSFLKPNAVPWATYPCTGLVDNGLLWITDSTTQTSGAIISGGGSFKVLASCVDPNWVVVGGTGGGGGGGGVNPGTAGALAWYATTGSVVGPSPISAQTACIGCAESLQFVSGALPTSGFWPPAGSYAYGFVGTLPATWDSMGNQKNLITGSGTAGYIPKFSALSALVNSGIQDSGTALSTAEPFSTTGALGGASLNIAGAVTFSGLLAGSGGTPLCITGSVVAVGGCGGGGGGGAAAYTTPATSTGQVISAATLIAAGVGPTTAIGVCLNSTGHVEYCDWVRDPITSNFTFNWGSTTVATLEVTGAIGGGGGGGGAPTGPAGGALAGTYPNPSLASTVTGASCGDPTHSCALTYNAAGQITAGSSALITFPSPAFNTITSGSNSTANMVCLGSCQISTSGSGLISANQINLVQMSTLATGILKNTTGTGVPSIAVLGTDYAPPTSGTSILKGSGSGGFSVVTATDVGLLGTLTNNTSGNAATATLLAAVPSQCPSGQLATGVAQNGNANCATAGGTGTVTNSGTLTSGQLIFGGGTTVVTTGNLFGYIRTNGSGGTFLSNDIRNYGAVCNGTDQNTAVLAALNAGLTSIYIPAVCTWVLPTSDWTYNPGPGNIIVHANGIPPGLHVIGENWLTSTIQTSTPSTTSGYMFVGPGAVLENINLPSYACISQNINSNYAYAHGGPCPIKFWVTASKHYSGVVSTSGTTVNWVSGDKFLWDPNGKYDWISNSQNGSPWPTPRINIGGTFYFVATVTPDAGANPQWSAASALTVTSGTPASGPYVYDQYALLSTNTNLFFNGVTDGPYDSNMMSAGGHGSGTYFAACDEVNCTGYDAGVYAPGSNAFHALMTNTGTGVVVADQSAPSSGVVAYSYFTGSATTSNVLGISQYVSAFTGNLITANMAANNTTPSGSFSGDFIQFKNATNLKFQIDSTGNTTFNRLTGTTSSVSGTEVLLGNSGDNNFFFDRDFASTGGDVIFNYNTTRGTSGAYDAFTIYDNGTNKNSMFKVTSQGASGTSNVVLPSLPTSCSGRPTGSLYNTTTSAVGGGTVVGACP